MGGERGCSMASGARGCYPAVVRHGNGLARQERVEQDDGVLAHGGGSVAVQDDHRIAWAESGRGRRHRERREQRHGWVMRDRLASDGVRLGALQKVAIPADATPKLIR